MHGMVYRVRASMVPVPDMSDARWGMGVPGHGRPVTPRYVRRLGGAVVPLRLLVVKMKMVLDLVHGFHDDGLEPYAQVGTDHVHQTEPGQHLVLMDTHLKYRKQYNSSQ